MGGLNKNKDRLRHSDSPTRWEDHSGTYRPPPRDEWEESTRFSMLSRNTSRIRTLAFSWSQGRIVNFAISLQYREGPPSPWINHITFDCRHGVAHLHSYKNGGRTGDTPEFIKTLNTPKDLQIALGLCLDRAALGRSKLEPLLGEVERNEAAINFRVRK